MLLYSHHHYWHPSNQKTQVLQHNYPPLGGDVPQKLIFYKKRRVRGQVLLLWAPVSLCSCRALDDQVMLLSSMSKHILPIRKSDTRQKYLCKADGHEPEQCYRCFFTIFVMPCIQPCPMTQDSDPGLPRPWFADAS